MNYRRLGRTGVKVSPLCLGAMMFGAWGNPDHDDCVAIIHAALDAGHQLHRHRRRLLGGRVRGDRRQGDRGAAATRSCSPPRSTRAMGARPQQRRQLAAVDHPGVREQPAPARHRLHRPLPDPPARPEHRHRRDARRAVRPRARRARCATSAARRSRPRPIVEAQWAAERRGRERFVCEQPPYSILVRGIEAEVLPTCERYGMGVIPWSPLAGGWLSGR